MLIEFGVEAEDAKSAAVQAWDDLRKECLKSGRTLNWGEDEKAEAISNAYTISKQHCARREARTNRVGWVCKLSNEYSLVDQRSMCQLFTLRNNSTLRS